MAHHFEGLTAELGQLIEKENAVMGERNLSRSGVAATAQEARIRDGVMRRAEGPLGQKRGLTLEHARHRVDLGGFDGLLLAGFG